MIACLKAIFDNTLALQLRRSLSLLPRRSSGVLLVLLCVIVGNRTIASAVNYSYDSLNRLTNVNYGNGSVISYTYDAAGNRLTSIAITSPTTGSSYTNTSASINLIGTASDNTGVTLIRWETVSGSIGTASGTTSWNINGIPLQPGDNFIDVIAYDAAGNTADAFLDVTYTPPVKPTIQVSKTGSSLNLSWPLASAGGFTLQYVDSLSPPILWTNVVTTVTTNLDNLNVTLPTTNAQRFFRLKQP